MNRWRSVWLNGKDRRTLSLENGKDRRTLSLGGVRLDGKDRRAFSLVRSSGSQRHHPGLGGPKVALSVDGKDRREALDRLTRGCLRLS